jgi:predicted lipid-binding transport protein (Tim44 family)
MDDPRWSFGETMSEIIDWLISTPLGLAAVIGGFLVLFTLIAVISERKTRKLYPDRNRRGTKAVARAKAKKKKAAEKDGEKSS